MPEEPRWERVLKGRLLSVLLFLAWGGLTVYRALPLFSHFAITEFFWVLYNGTISVLFLIRVRPTTVSMRPEHYFVALGTVFCGWFFEPILMERGWARKFLSWSLIYGGFAMSAYATATLGRSYDLFPAVRRIKTRRLYARIRHPMYAASMLIRVGYVIRNPVVFNFVLLLPVLGLYWLRAKYEESILREDPTYREYARTVRYRFIPGLT